MFGFRPTQIFFDPWSHEYVHVPEDLIYTAPYRQPTYDVFSLPDYPHSRATDAYHSYSRPYRQGPRHPAHALCQQHPFYQHPQAERMLRRAQPAAHSYANAKAAAAHAQPVHDDDSVPGSDIAEPWPAVADRACAACHSMPPSSYASAQDSCRAYPVSPPPDLVHASVHARQPSPFSTAQQTIGQQPPRPDQPNPASVASSRGRDSIPVYAVNSAGRPTAAEPVAVHQSTPAARPAQQHLRSQQQQPQMPAHGLSRSEAATLIQSWWRMRRLARRHSTLKALALAAAQLRSTSNLFLKYKEESSSPAVRPANQQQQQQQAVFHGLSHKQYLELNELAMRVLLQLDATSCGVPELRAVRKRLIASAIKLLDEIQAAYSAAVNASMELPDDVVRAAVRSMAQAPSAASAVAALAVPVAETEYGDQQWRQQAPDTAEAVQLIKAEQQQQQRAAVAGQNIHAQEEAATSQSAPLEEQQWRGSLIQGAGQEGHAVGSASPRTSQGSADQDDQLAVGEGATNLQHQSESQVQDTVLPTGVRVVFVYPGSRADAATQTYL